MTTTHQVDRRIEDVNRAMLQVRHAMRGIQIRTAGFKKDHDAVARSMAKATLLLEQAKPLFRNGTDRKPRRR